ncbi:unnamed protein product, partial [Polarella glacialis]
VELASSASASASDLPTPDIRAWFGCRPIGGTATPATRVSAAPHTDAGKDIRTSGEQCGPDATSTEGQAMQTVGSHVAGLRPPSALLVAQAEQVRAREDRLDICWAQAVRRCGRWPRTTPPGSLVADQAHEPSSLPRSRPLNQMQQAAASEDVSRPLVIMAGAGTGKTTTLLARVLHLIRSGGANPKHIVLLTFTNSSADDIADRLAGSLGHNMAKQVTCTTIHSFSLALLRCFGSRLGFSSAVRVAEKTLLYSILRDAWDWSVLEAERHCCAKWLDLDILGPRRWQQIFQILAQTDPEGFRKCLLESPPPSTPQLLRQAASEQQEQNEQQEQQEPRPQQHPSRKLHTHRTEHRIVPLATLLQALDGPSPSLRLGYFQYGVFFFGAKGQGEDGLRWWAAPKAFKLQGTKSAVAGTQVPKFAVLECVELLPPLAGTLPVETGVDLPRALRDALYRAPLAQARVCFRVPVMPPKGSPAALRAKEDPRWRQLLARSIFLVLRQRYAPNGEEGVPRPECLPPLFEHPKKGVLPGMLKKITMAKRDGMQPNEFMLTKRPGCLAYCYACYKERLRKDGLVDFDDMLVLAAKLLQEDYVRQVVRAQQRHVLVDEFQDVSQRQLEVVKQLVETRISQEASFKRSFCAVGDDDQTIYTWNGSTTEIFKLLQEHTGPQTKLVQLTENYRSSRRILQLAHMTLTQNSRRVPKELQACSAWAEDEAECPPPLLVECGTPDDEACAIADKLEVLLGRKQAESENSFFPASAACHQHPREIAVLFRCFNFNRGKAHHPLVQELQRRQIPYFVVRDQPLWEQAFAQDLLAYLRLTACEPGDFSDFAFLRALSRPSRGCGPVVVQRLLERQKQLAEAAEAEGAHHGRASAVPSLLAVAQQLVRFGSRHEHAAGAADGYLGTPTLRPPDLSRKVLAGLEGFLGQLAKLRVACATLRVDQALELVARVTGYADWYLARQVKTRGGGPKLTEEEDEEEGGQAEDEDDEDVDCEDDAEGDNGEQDGESGVKLPQKIADLVAAAGCFAERWEGLPFARSGGEVDQLGTKTVPTLFELCGQRLMKMAAASPEVRTLLAEELPETLLDQLCAECGRRGRLQTADFLTRVAMDPKDAAAIGVSSRRRRRPSGPSSATRGVCISTIHAAKGLEWPTVFVARWNEEYLPMAPQQIEKLGPDGRVQKCAPTEWQAAEHQEEERRLAHVATTRAQKRLVLTYVRSFSSWKLEKAALSSLPLPEPLLPEGSRNAALWKRVRPKTAEELAWSAEGDASE